MDTVLHVLVVDDSPAMRELLATYIKALRTNVHADHSVRIDVSQASDGEEALVCLDDRAVDLIFLDLEMPRMGGLDLLEIKKDDVRIRDVPVIVCASPGEDAKVEAARDLGARGHIDKPYTWTSVTEAWRFL